MTLPGIIDNRPGVLELVWVKHVHPVEQRQCSEICCSICEFPLLNCEAFGRHQIEQVVARRVVHACVKHSDTQYKGTSLCKQPFLGAIEICKHASKNGCLRKWLPPKMALEFHRGLKYFGQPFLEAAIFGCMFVACLAGGIGQQHDAQ